MDNISTVLINTSFGVSPFLWKEAPNFCVRDRGSPLILTFLYFQLYLVEVHSSSYHDVSLLFFFCHQYLLVAALNYNKWISIPFSCNLLQCRCHVYLLLLLFFVHTEVFKSEQFAHKRPMNSSDLIIKCGGRYRLVLCVHLCVWSTFFHRLIC